MKKQSGVVLSATLHFSSKEKAKKHFSEMLSRYSPGDTLNEPDSEELGLLLRRHEFFEEKVGVGVRRFKVTRPVGFPGQCFSIERIDGTEISFSYRSCLETYTKRRNVMAAARYAVAPTIHLLRVEAFEKGPVFCAVTGAPVEWATAHVDHASPLFVEIVEAWRGGRDWSEIAVIDSPEIVGVRLSEEESESFCAYHDSVANLRIVAAEVNFELNRQRVLKNGQESARVG